MKLPKTSRQAYDSITLEHKQAMWAKIVKTLRRCKAGATADEIALRIGCPHVEVARRMAELVNKGIVINLPKVTRPTRTGRAAMVRTLSKKYAA